MKLKIERARALLEAFDFQRLFIDEMGWDNHAASLTVNVEGGDFALNACAQKRGVVVWRLDSAPGSRLPDREVRKKIERQVAKTTLEHLIIFTDSAKKEQIWCWARREVGKPVAVLEHFWHVGSANRAFLQKLEAITFTFAEEGGLGLIDVTNRLRSALDVERVTKRFFDQFTKEHNAFLGFISGIEDVADKEWYASLMLNRLMFIYFMQKKGFLNGESDYLRTRLAKCQAEKGKDTFYSFYRYFLIRLFHEGLGSRPHDPELVKLLGKIPYLNGGLFEKHPIEERCPDIQIPDAAFERIFAYFDRYTWHLDERPLRNENEINPDVLGYIFEKYINQKQMGAYYTKEDITEYISKNTVIPFLFDATKAKCKVAFENPGGPTVWDHLRDDPDRYIYPAVKHGISWDIHVDDGRGAPLDAPRDLPANIAAGIVDVAQRGDWNRSAPADFALPTEIWREVVARRTRYAETRAKLANGEVREINDLITLNLDIRQFAQDVIERCEGPDLLRAFWKAIESVTVLDPTCGSGAFLFAALNILEPLYAACLDRMEAFVADRQRASGKEEDNPKGFREVLARIDAHPNARYFILKSIILNNLFGVDIMEEAVEICKLRLFLKLAAQVEPDMRAANLGIEPLPDIDFNIRSGNTLVGFTTYGNVSKSFSGKLDLGGVLDRITTRASDAQQAFSAFRRSQINADTSVPAVAKHEVRRRLAELSDELDLNLASEFGITSSNDLLVKKWKRLHEPFHWFVEFHGIMHDGGFDVIVGNPPYVASSKIGYLSSAQKALKFPDIYAHVALRSLDILSRDGRCGMIIPLSITFSEDFQKLRGEISKHGERWYSSFDNIPAAVFSGVSQRCTIWLSAPSGESTNVSQMYRWRSSGRPNLVNQISYTSLPQGSIGVRGISKLSSPWSRDFLQKVSQSGKKKKREILAVGRLGGVRLGFSQAARNFISVFLEDPPCLDASSLASVQPSKIGGIKLTNEDAAFASLAALLGEAYFHYWLVQGDGFDVTGWVLRDFLQCLNYLDDESFQCLNLVGRILHGRRHEALAFKKNAGKFVGNFNYRSLYEVTRRSDLILLSGLGINRFSAVNLLGDVQRVLAINAFAGEKSIPPEVKKVLKPLPRDVDAEQEVLNAVDVALVRRFGFSREELDFLISRDVVMASDLDLESGDVPDEEE